MQVEPFVPGQPLLHIGVLMGRIIVQDHMHLKAFGNSKQLPDATTQVNILQRIGGALGAALFAVILARGPGRGSTRSHQTGPARPVT